MNTNWRTVVLLGLVLASVVTTDVIHRNKLEEGLLKIIEKCKKGDVSSLPIPLPSLKTLKIPQIKANLDGISIHLSQIMVKGIEDMSILSLKASESRLSTLIVLNIPNLAITADKYIMRVRKFSILTIPTSGAHFTAKIKNLRASAKLRLARRGKDTVISKLNLSYAVEHAQVQLHDSSYLVNAEANHMIKNLINEKFKPLVHAKIIDIVNRYLKGHTPKELVHIVSNF